MNKNSLKNFGIGFISKEKKTAFRKYEEFIINFLFETLIELDFLPLPKYIGVNHVISPKFSKKRGIRTSRISIEILRDWLSPSLVLEHRDTHYLMSIYYDGYPLMRTRLRPDLSLVKGEISPKVRSLSSMKTVIDVLWKLRLRDQSERILGFSPIVDDFGPEPIGEGEVLPFLIVDPTIKKSENILEQQVKNYFRKFKAETIIIISKSAVPFSGATQRAFANSLFIIDEFDEKKDDFSERSREVISLLTHRLKPFLNKRETD